MIKNASVVIYAGKKYEEKKYFFGILKVTEETESDPEPDPSQRCGSGSASQCHRSPTLLNAKVFNFIAIRS